MSATALRISSSINAQVHTKSLQAFTETLTQKVHHAPAQFSSYSHCGSSLAAMVTPGLRRIGTTPMTSKFHRHFSTTTTTTQCQLRTDIWNRNFARLYARRMLELAALAAAARHIATTGTHADAHGIALPEKWQDWELRDWTDDLMATLGTTKWQRLWSSTKRLVSLTCLLAPMVVLYPLSLVSPRIHDFSWTYALWGIEQAGPTLIKLVQWATTRQDLFSPEFCLHFGKLRDDTVGHSWAETQRILQEELGENFADLVTITSAQNQPIGSGCIAQVYQGILLKDTVKYPKGTEIALKIQHPGIWNKVCVDFYLLAKVADWLEGLPRLNLKYLSLADTVRQFRDIMLPQLDLRIEAKNLQRFNADFANDSGVTFPHPLEELTTSRVLVETFVHGTPIMEFTKAPVELRRQVASIGLKTTLNMIFLKDFIHGDLHP